MPIDKRGIDHVIVLVRDMDQAVSNYERLGFQTTPRMHHPFGTANNLIMFKNSFLEILGVVRPDQIGGIGTILRDMLEQKEGVSHFALQSDDAAADREEFLTKGLEPSAISDFERQVTLPSGDRVNAVVSVCGLANLGTPRVLMFVSQQHVAEAIWVPEWQLHPNGAQDVSCLTIVSDNPKEQFERTFARLFGRESIEGDGSSVVASAGGGRIEALTPQRALDRFAGVAIAPEPVLPYIAATTVRVSSLSQFAKVARGNGVDLRQLRSGGLLVEPHNANGVALEFVER